MDFTDSELKIIKECVKSHPKGYEIMYSDGTSKYFDVPIKAGKAFNQESELSGRYCEDLDRNDFRTCHKERQKTRGEKNSKEFSVSI